MGYVRGNFWVVDPVYDEYLSLPCGRALNTAIRLSRTGQDHLSFEKKYSYLARQYTCEVFQMWKPEKSAQWYKTSIALGYAAHPLEAMIQSIHKAEDMVQTPRIKACILECEMWLLNRALKAAKATEGKIEIVLDTLAGVLRSMTIVEPLSASPEDVAAAHWENIQSGAISCTLDEIQPDNLARFFGKSALDEDDDL